LGRLRINLNGGGLRIALGIEYDGSMFCGWQTQPSGCGVQDAIERAASTIAGQDIETVCAGRTDAGVHAIAQVVHFDTEAERPLTAWVRGVNALLPAGVAVIWAQPVDPEFHARYSARERRYRYLLLNRSARPGAYHRQVGWFHLPLDVERMRAGAAFLIGTHDFSAFRSAECQAKSPVRELRRLSIERRGDCLAFNLAANAFLHHMVRNIVGSLVYVGSGRRDPSWIAEVLAAGDRAAAAPTAASAGLYLVQVSYDARWKLPESAGSENWLPVETGP
jgi:tRNA pseudouridine38-40 synthase